jgi:quercetin dioxygenase-like cupin family protein
MDRFTETPEKELAPGITGRYLHGSGITYGRVRILKGSLMPMHSHPHEQLTHIHEGTLVMVVGRDVHRLEAGDLLAIPPNTPHSAEALTDVSLTDVFTPVREDYR